MNIWFSTEQSLYQQVLEPNQ